MRHLPRSLWHVAFGDRTVTFDDGFVVRHTRRQLLRLVFCEAVLFPRWYHWRHMTMTEVDPDCERGKCRRFKVGSHKGLGWSTAGECVGDRSSHWHRRLNARSAA